MATAEYRTSIGNDSIIHAHMGACRGAEGGWHTPLQIVGPGVSAGGASLAIDLKSRAHACQAAVLLAPVLTAQRPLPHAHAHHAQTRAHHATHIPRNGPGALGGTGVSIVGRPTTVLYLPPTPP